jgi:predicted MFS family arabinose efflux permease
MRRPDLTPADGAAVTAGPAGSPVTGPAPAALRRDRITAIGYSALASYAYFLYALSPFLVLLRHRLGFSYTVLSLHSTVFAAGSLLAGLSFAQVLRRTGRHRLFRLALLGTGCGALLLAAGTTLAVTLPAAALLGVAGPMLQTSSLAMLSAHHPAHRDRVLVEANAAASAAAVLAPALIGSLSGSDAGWRTGLALPVAALAVLQLLTHRQPLPEHPEQRPAGTSATAGGRLPAAFWVRCAVVGAAAGTEFGLVFYGSPLMAGRLGMDIGHAATVMTLFALGVLAGRLVGSRLVSRPDRAPRLLVWSWLLAAAGIGAFWASDRTWASEAALLVAGAGVANLFPLSLSLAIAAVPERSDTAAARAQAVVSAAIMLAPLTLGALSDRIGVVRAFTVEEVLVVTALLLVAVGRRRTPARSAL